MPAVDRDAKVCALAAQLSVPSAPPSSHCQDEPSQRNRLARHRPRKSRQKIKVELGKVKARQQRLAKSKTEYENHMSGYFLQKVIGWEEEGTFLNRWITKCVLGGRVKRGILDFDYLQNLSTTARECRPSQQFGDKEQSDSPNPQDRSAFVLQNQTYLHLPWMQDSKRKFRGKPLRNGRA